MADPDNGTLLLKNSLRLLRDARLLLQNDRYPSAAALAILSLEEFGKFIAAIGLIVNPSIDKRLHVKKQTDVSLFVLRSSYALAVADHFGVRVSLRGPRVNILSSDSEHDRLLRAYLSIDEANMDGDAFSSIVGSPLMGRALRLFTLVYNGDLNAMKNRALYADITSDGAVLDPDVEITAKKAEDLIGMCNDILGFFNDRILASPAV